MRICVLSSADESRANPYEETCDSNISRLLPEHEFEFHFIHKQTALADVTELAQQGFDVFVNMCDGAYDESRTGIEAVEALEHLGLPFTGASSEFYGASRERMKEVCQELNLPTSKYAFASDIEAVERTVESLRFPLFVKHYDSYSSVGLRPSSRVEDLPALRKEAKRMLDLYGRILIEEFIEGEEISALILENPNSLLEPIVLCPVRPRVSSGLSFLTADTKDALNRSFLPLHDAGIRARVEEIVKKLFIGLRATSYGRCDLRMNSEGDLFILEMNANCQVFSMPYDYPSTADAILLNDPLGPKGFLSHIILTGLFHSQSKESAQ